MHALSEEFDATELRRARASLETIDLGALEFERVTHLHIPVPAITRGTVARTHELKSMIHVQSCCFANLNLLLFCRSRCRRCHRCLSSMIQQRCYHGNVTLHFSSLLSPIIKPIKPLPQIMN